MCDRRFGTSNPERIDNPVWEWMIREGHNCYAARKSLGLESDYNKEHPDWCFDRFGMAKVKMPDGRRICIAGEHEDYYDPDFCIYNDVIVRDGDSIEIYAYPRDVFPPTDFHTATLLGDEIYIIGSLGYPEERGKLAPVLAIDTRSLRIRRVETSGESPGWLSRHQAINIDESTIEVSRGECFIRENDKWVRRDNTDVFHLDARSGVWQRVTSTDSWRQFAIGHEPDFDRSIDDIRGPFAWYTGEVLAELGYPVTVFPDDGDEDDDEDEADSRDRFHVINFHGVRVRITPSWNEIRVVFEGELPASDVDRLVDRLRELASATDLKITKVREL